MVQPHIIRRQVLDITLGRQEDSFDIQNRLSMLYHLEIPKVLQEVCDRVVGPDQFLQIEDLEIDLGAIPLEHLEEEFGTKVREHLFETLTALSHRINRVQGGALPELAGESQRVSRFSSFPEADRIVGARVFKLDLVRHFLRTGALPWWADKSSLQGLEEVLEELLQTASEELRVLLEEEIKDLSARHRLIYQSSDALLSKLVELLVPDYKESAGGWVADLEQVFQQARLPGVSPSEARLHVWDGLFAEGSRQEVTENELLQVVLQALSPRYHLSVQTVLEELKGSIHRLLEAKFRFSSTLQHLIESRSRETQRPDTTYPPPAERVAKPGDDPVDGSELLFPGDGRRTEAAGKSTQAKKVSLGPKESDGTEDRIPVHKMRLEQKAETRDRTTESLEVPVSIEEHYVENAGLVILWPYLGNFFRELQLLKDDEFINEAEAMRAIHLLQYLATGDKETPEFMLALNKLLCGWRLDKPVCKDIGLSDIEELESEKLLGAVIAHWNALKNTSIAGFRSSFLRRNGVLKDQENNWQLQVERKPYDLLLEQLPWGISIIRLSWMKKMLMVEWQ